MVMRDGLPEPLSRDARILASDISARMLVRARDAIYADEAVAELPRDVLRRHFVPTADERWQVAEPVRRLVRCARLNLMSRWPIYGPFDVIFCRNVMIYFDRPTQAALVDRFRALLVPGGHLVVGHSESLTGMAHGLTYVQPGVYVA